MWTDTCMVVELKITITGKHIIVYVCAYWQILKRQSFGHSLTSSATGQSDVQQLVRTAQQRHHQYLFTALTFRSRLVSRLFLHRSPPADGSLVPQSRRLSCFHCKPFVYLVARRCLFAFESRGLFV